MINFVLVLALALGLGAGCSSKDQTASRADDPNQNGDDATQSQDDRKNSDRKFLQEEISFVKTLAAGNKILSIKNISVQYAKTNVRNKSINEKWTEDCDVTGSGALDSEFPAVTLKLPEVVCPFEVGELVDLSVITKELRYSAEHSPGPLSQNQFRLTLAPTTYPSLEIIDAASINALTRDGALFFDFLGKNESNFAHYVEVSVAPVPGNQPATFRVLYNRDNFLNGDHVELKIYADVLF